MDQLQERMDKISQQQLKQMEALDAHIFNKSDTKFVENPPHTGKKETDNVAVDEKSIGSSSYEEDFNSEG